MGRHSKLRSSLVELGKLNHALSIDTQIALKFLNRSARQHSSFSNQSNEKLPFDLFFWSRAAVRSFFSQVEGTSFCMRNTAAKPRNASALGITPRKRAELLELRFDRSTGETTQKLAPNKVGDNLKLAFRYYPKIFESDYTLNTSSPSWKAFMKILVPARNSLTHGGTFEDFYSAEALQTLESCRVWFLVSLAEMLSSCAEQVGVDLPADDLKSQLQESEFDESSYTPIASPQEEFLDEVAEFQGRSMKLLNTSIILFRREQTYAFDLYNQSNNLCGFQDPLTQFFLRNLIRSQVTFFEGVTNLVSLFTKQAEARGEISTSEHERSRLSYIDILDRAAATAEIFSAKFGFGTSFEAASQHWTGTRTVVKYRDRLTHPRSNRNLEFQELQVLGALKNCLSWQLSFIEPLQLDHDKLVSQGRSSGSIVSTES